MPEPVDVLEAQLTAMSDTRDNLAGLIEKTARVQAELESAGFSEFSQAMGEPFTALSMAAEQLEAIVHKVEIERNRIRNEA